VIVEVVTCFAAAGSNARLKQIGAGRFQLLAHMAWFILVIRSRDPVFAACNLFCFESRCAAEPHQSAACTARGSPRAPSNRFR